jgi:pimeloyl-ACP methyl ester carboxylesterase
MHPDLVSALILQGAPLDGFPPPADSPEVIPIERWSALAAAGNMDQLRAEWLKHPLMATAPGTSELRRELKTMVDDYAGLDLLNPSAPEHLPSMDLSRIRVPSLIIEGENETPWRRQIARKLAGEIAGAKLETIAGAGHLANMDRPEEFNRVVLEFLLSRVNAD